MIVINVVHLQTQPTKIKTKKKLGVISVDPEGEPVVWLMLLQTRKNSLIQ